MDDVWQRVTERLRERLGPVVVETWIDPLTLVSLEAGSVTLQAPNKFFRDWICERHLDEIRRSLIAESGAPVEVTVTVGHNGDGHQRTERTTAARSTAVPNNSPPPAMANRRSQLNPRLTFAEFVVGSSNQFAHAAAQAVVLQPGEKYNPLFIYGGVGLGKTHLATAVGHSLQSEGRRRVLFLPAEIFMNELISSLRRDRMSEFKDKMRLVDALILDDVQFLAARERTQEEFFHTFNSLHAERHQIVLTSDKAPKDIAGLEERLRNRFESGLIADIAP